MQWWLNLSFIDVAHYVPLAQVAEECGFAGVVVSDHLVAPAELTSQYPYGTGGATAWPSDTMWPDCWIAVTAMAAQTERLRFATAIYIAPLREPLALAKAISTASVFTGGRIACGFGTGWMREEYDAVQVPFAGRAARLDEMLTSMKALWTGEMVEFHGHHIDFPAVQMRPVPSEAVPVYIGGHSPAALRRAVAHDGWIAAHQTVATTVADTEQLERLLGDTGRARADFTMLATISRRRHIAEVDQLTRLDAVAVPVSVIEANPALDVRIAAVRAFAAQRIPSDRLPNQGEK